MGGSNVKTTVVHVVGGSTTFERKQPKKPTTHHSPLKKHKVIEAADESGIASGKRFRNF